LDPPDRELVLYRSVNKRFFHEVIEPGIEGLIARHNLVRLHSIDTVDDIFDTSIYKQIRIRYRVVYDPHTGYNHAPSPEAMVQQK